MVKTTPVLYPDKPVFLKTKKPASFFEKRGCDNLFKAPPLKNKFQIDCKPIDNA